MSRDGSGALLLSPGGVTPTTKEIEPTRIALAMNPHIGKVIEIELSPVVTYIRFTICPKGQEVTR